MSARQRLLDVQNRVGNFAKKSMGQNYLINDHVIEKIIKSVRFFKPDQIIEVGPGPGALTFFLRQMSCPLTLIELDHVWAQYWNESTQSGEGASDSIVVLNEDALKLDWGPLYKNSKIILVSNLPYQISASIVIERSLEKSGVHCMVLMFQKEVAQRMRAKPKTEDYGLLSVIAQVFWRMEIVADAGPRDFVPPPQIASRVLSFERKESHIEDRQKFLNFIKTAFSQRRKILKSNISDLVNRSPQKEEDLIAWLQQRGLTDKARAEELTSELFVELYQFLGFR